MPHHRNSSTPRRAAMRPIFAALAAAALVFGPLSASQARAGGEDVARAAFGIAAAVIVGAVIADALDNDRHDRPVARGHGYGHGHAGPPRQVWRAPGHVRGGRYDGRYDRRHDDWRHDDRGHDGRGRDAARSPAPRRGDDPWRGDSRPQRADRGHDQDGRGHAAAETRGRDDARHAAVRREMERRRFVQARR